MPLIFEIEQKPVYKIANVFGVEIPVYGEFTVAETIAIEKAELALGENPSTTEKLRAWLAAWLILRLHLVKPDYDYKEAEYDILSQLNKSTALIDALWEVYKGERFGLIVPDAGDEPVTEGKESEPLPTLSESGTPYISNSHVADLQQNSLVVLDSSVSA
jgi:hypothetical protein